MNDFVNTSQENDVLCKIGRNVVLFQKIEGMLKALSSFASYQGSIAEIRSQHEKHLTSLGKKSFGQVVGLFFEKVFVDQEQDEPSDDSVLFALSVRIESRERSELKEMLESLVNERNALIHTRLLAFDSSSKTCCQDLESFLDAQVDRLAPVYARVLELFEMMRDARPLIAQALEIGLSQLGDEQDA